MENQKDTQIAFYFGFKTNLYNLFVKLFFYARCRRLSVSLGTIQMLTEMYKELDKPIHMIVAFYVH